MITRPSAASPAGGRLSARRRAPGTGLHVHWFRWAGDDPLGPAGVYACRCGEVRPGL